MEFKIGEYIKLPHMLQDKYLIIRIYGWNLELVFYDMCYVIGEKDYYKQDYRAHPLCFLRETIEKIGRKISKKEIFLELI